MHKIETTQDTLWQGKISIHQPALGYRFAIDPIFLASFIEARNGSILDVGCGVGTALICYMKRAESEGYKYIHATGIDFQTPLASIARYNLEVNNLKGNIVQEDIMETSLQTNSFDIVISNPPYMESNTAKNSLNEIKHKCNAHTTTNLAQWIDFCTRMLKPKGEIYIIHMAQKLDEIIEYLSKKCGNIKVYPLWPFEKTAANRVIISATKSSKAGCTILPGMVIHEADGNYSYEAMMILNEGKKIESN